MCCSSESPITDVSAVINERLQAVDFNEAKSHYPPPLKIALEEIILLGGANTNTKRTWIAWYNAVLELNGLTTAQSRLMCIECPNQLSCPQLITQATTAPLQHIDYPCTTNEDVIASYCEPIAKLTTIVKMLRTTLDDLHRQQFPDTKSDVRFIMGPNWKVYITPC